MITRKRSQSLIKTAVKNASFADSREPFLPTKFRKEIEELNLFDNQYMLKFFEEDEENGFKCTELILRILLDKPPLKVVKMKSQRGVYGVRGERDVIFDILAVDSMGQYYDIEFQRAGSLRDIARRARFYSGKLDHVSLKKGKGFRALKDSYVIFITERDLYKRGLPFYDAPRTLPKVDNMLFGDGSHIIIVNGSYMAHDDFGRLMHDFRCKKVEAMYHAVLADQAGAIKGTYKGGKDMSGVFEKFGKKCRKEASAKARTKERLANIKAVIRNFGVSKEQAMEKLDIPEKDRAQLLLQL